MVYPVDNQINIIDHIQILIPKVTINNKILIYHLNKGLYLISKIPIILLI